MLRNMWSPTCVGQVHLWPDVENLSVAQQNSAIPYRVPVLDRARGVDQDAVTALVAHDARKHLEAVQKYVAFQEVWQSKISNPSGSRVKNAESRQAQAHSRSLHP